MSRKIGATERVAARRVVRWGAGSLVVVGLLVGGCEPTPAPPPVIGALPEFQLTSANGKMVDRSALRGEVWIVNLFFTRCPSVCPLLMKRVEGLLQELESADVRFLSVSVDPTNDTPALLRRYGEERGIDSNRWTLATGRVEELRRFATEGLKLGAPEKPDLHSLRLVLVDREGQVRGAYASNDPLDLDRLRKDVRAVLAAKDRG